LTNQANAADNLSAAVKLVLRGRRREETDRFIALRSHYLFDSAFTLASLEGAHENKANRSRYRGPVIWLSTANARYAIKGVCSRRRCHRGPEGPRRPRADAACPTAGESNMRSLQYVHA
jgi:hypothetical protein